MPIWSFCNTSPKVITRHLCVEGHIANAVRTVSYTCSRWHGAILSVVWCQDSTSKALVVLLYITVCPTICFKGNKSLFEACTGDTICTTIFQCDIGSVPGRNRSLFCCIFLAHYCIWSAVVQNFHLGRSSYMLHRLIRFSCIYAVCMSTTLCSALQFLKHGHTEDDKWRIMFDSTWNWHMCYRLERDIYHVLPRKTTNEEQAN